MARFIYLGEGSNVKSKHLASDQLKEIVIPFPNGRRESLKPKTKSGLFEIGQDIGHDITDSYALMLFRADKRYKEVSSSFVDSKPLVGYKKS